MCLSSPLLSCFFFFFNDTATTEIYTLSLHDALPIWRWPISGIRFPIKRSAMFCNATLCRRRRSVALQNIDRKSTRLNSSHSQISYAVFCLKKNNENIIHLTGAKAIQVRPYYRDVLIL